MAASMFPVPLSGIQTSTLTTTGDTLYASAANNPARLGVGSTGQVLTVASGVPSWSTPGTSGLAFVRRSTFTNVATTTTTFDGVFTSAYKSYYVVYEDIQPTAGSQINLLFQWRVGSTTQSAASYYGGYFGFYTPSGTGSASWDTGGTSAKLASMQTGGYVTIGNQLITKVGSGSQGPMQSGTFYSQAPGAPTSSGGSYNAAIVADGFILSASSNFTGTVAIYGLASA